MDLKRELMERTATEDPAPGAFEAWLLEQVLAAPAGGPVRAMCAELLDEYRVARADPAFRRWLAAGAFSEDADAGEGDDGGAGGPGARGERRRRGWREDQYARDERRDSNHRAGR